jgi:RNA polymerase sigma factor (sigma-70 family)
MSLVAAGEISAMGFLYEKYKRPLYAYFFKVTCGDSHTSEDMVHTVFYRAIRYKATFTGQGSFAKWLFSIAHNASIDQGRKSRNTIEYKADILQGIPLQFDDQDEKDEKAERIALLEKAMGDLADEERELVVLCKIECLRYDDVAAILGISEGNVKIRMFRAIRKLRDIVMKLEKRNYETHMSHKNKNK